MPSIMKMIIYYVRTLLRIFKRQVVIEGLVKSAESKEMAIHLLTELIQAGYLENNTIPEKKIYEVAEILEKIC